MPCADRARPLLAALLLAGLLASACEPRVPAAEIPERMHALGQPDIVVIVIDTLRADHTTPYGYERDTTPELSAWAARGVLFENVRAHSSWTKMSMASLFASLWPRSHAIHEAQDGLGDAAVTLAEVLRAAGYQTFGVQTNGWLHQSFGFHQGFDRYAFPLGGAKKAGHDKPSLWAHADRVVEEAQHLIDARDPERPMFLYLHLMDVHEYAAPPEFQSFGNDNVGMYDAAIRWSDDALRRVRKALAAAGTLDRTLLVLTADHGETFGEHGVHGHARNVLTPVIHVPLVLRLPFPVHPRRVSAQVRIVDLAPTLLELAGVAAPEDFEGLSLVPLATSEGAGQDRSSYAGLGMPLFHDASVQAALTTGSWTFARNEPAGDEPEAYQSRAAAPGARFLFDRTIDPGERVNLVGLEATRAEEMSQALELHLEKTPMKRVRDEDVRIDPAIAERLRAMGYLR